MIKPTDPYSSATMNSTDDFDLLLTRELRNDQDYLADDGFTSKVMTQLHPQPAISRPTQWFITGVPVAVIGWLVFSQMPVQDIGLLIDSKLATLDPLTLVKGSALVSAGVVLGCLGWLARQTRLL